MEQYTLLVLLCFTSLVSARNPQCHTNATAAVQQLSGWNYLGCYHDTWNDRLLKASSVKLSNNTVVGCAKLCSTQGHTVFGVEDNLECYCDTTLHPMANTSLSDQAYCNSPCCGDASVLCGGVWYIGVYQISSSGREFTTRDRIAVGVSIGVMMLLAAVILGWKYYNRRSVSKSRSLLPRFAFWTCRNSEFKGKFKLADRRPWRRLSGRFQNPVRHWQNTGSHDEDSHSNVTNAFRQCVASNRDSPVIDEKHLLPTDFADLLIKGQCEDLPELPGDNRQRQPYEEVINEVGGKVEAFSKDIRIAIAGGPYAHARALLDTQCQSGNWISRRLVERLGKTSEILGVNNPPSLKAVSGHSITPYGILSLDWRWNETGNRVHRCDFYVFPESDHLDIIFGAEYIAAEDLVTVPVCSFSPLTQHRKDTDAQEAEKAKAKQQQEKKKAEVEARIKASRNKEQ